MVSTSRKSKIKNKNNNNHVSVPESVGEETPLKASSPLANPAGVDDDDDDDDDDYDGEEYFAGLRGDSVRRESKMADQLSMRLLAVPDDDSETEDAILNETLNMGASEGKIVRPSISYRDGRTAKQIAFQRLFGMVGLVIMGLALLVAALYVGVQFIGPPNQPVGPYQLVERQVRVCLFACLAGEFFLCRTKEMSLSSHLHSILQQLSSSH